MLVLMLMESCRDLEMAEEEKDPDFMRNSHLVTFINDDVRVLNLNLDLDLN